MKINDLKAYVVPVPPPHKGGQRWIFLKLITDEGVEGVGECTWHGTHRLSAVHLAREMFEGFVRGADPFNIERVWWDLYTKHAKRHTGPIVTPVVSALEMACWDIVGRALGQPVYNLLGGRYNERLRAYTYLYGWHVGDPPEQAAEDALKYVEAGFTAVKFDPVGSMVPDRLETLRYVENVVKAVREAVGDRCDILIGTHGQLTTHSAIRLARRLEPYDPLWFEEPVAPENVSEMARIAEHTNIPIATGERLLTRYEYVELLRHQAASIVQMDISITGGILEGKKIAAMAEAHYAQIAPHVWGGPLAAAAAVQVDVCCPNFLIQEGIEQFAGFHREVLQEPLVWRDGYIIPPAAPGLGISLNEDLVSRHLVAA
jgi:2-dehydro-3-deoxyphosphogalactonate aldolase